MEVEISIVKEMETIQAFINALDTDDSVIFPLPTVSSHILSRIMELILKEYDQELVKRLSHEELKEICMVANYLNMKTLLHLTASAIANLIQNKSVEFVRHFFNILMNGYSKMLMKIELNASIFYNYKYQFRYFSFICD
ncbi:SKP1-like protein 14 [Phaseolus vulgaris]|uniref:SKP1-like protein 14 n=1 Tax=Phaseolus vulgaris TaxID=3885 RepID=UPI0035CA8881